MRLEGCKAIVTGCSRGLGVSVAEALWNDGSDLIVISRSEDALWELRRRLLNTGTARQQIHIIPADLRDPLAPQKIVAEARRLWSGMDILVNNAGMGGPIGMVADNCWSAWRETIQVNLLAPVELCRLSIGWMRETGGGRIINVAGGGASSPRPNFSAYATAKCGLVRFSETIATEVSSLGIRVNCVAPGALNTEMLQEILRAGPEQAGVEEFERVRKSVATGASDPKLAAELIVYLASQESAGITGKLISAVWDPWRNLHRHLDDLRDSDVYTLRRIIPEERGKAWIDE